MKTFIWPTSPDRKCARRPEKNLGALDKPHRKSPPKRGRIGSMSAATLSVLIDTCATSIRISSESGGASDVVDDRCGISRYLVTAPRDVAVGADEHKWALICLAHFWIVNLDLLQRQSASALCR